MHQRAAAIVAIFTIGCVVNVNVPPTEGAHQSWGNVEHGTRAMYRMYSGQYQHVPDCRVGASDFDTCWYGVRCN